MNIEYLIIHCSDSPNGRSNTIEDIDAWHRQRGFCRSPRYQKQFNPRLSAVGYHFVIPIDGNTKPGRRQDEVGAHAVGYNAKSLGICLVGADCFTPAQWNALHNLVDRLMVDYPGVRILGHRQLPGVHKTCPGFDVGSWLACAMKPLPGHILE